MQGWAKLSWPAVALALLQSLCALAALLAGIGTVLGISLLATFGGVLRAAQFLHADAIRLPMITAALLVAVLNLWVVGRTRRLRQNPAGAWRRRSPEARQLWHERVQVTVAVVTIILVLTEMSLHLHNHGHI